MNNYYKNIIKYFKEKDYLCFFDSENEVLNVFKDSSNDYDWMKLFKHYINDFDDNKLKNKLHLYLTIICSNPNYSYDDILDKISELLKAHDGDIDYRIMDIIFNDEIFIKEIKNKSNSSENEENNYTDSVRQYINEISRYKLLDKDEEYELAVRCKNGDKEARKKLINSNLRLVVSMAKNKKYLKNYDLLDAIQYGNIGLIIAIDKFDPSLGIRLSTYAAYYIDAKMRNKELNENNLITRNDCSKLKAINSAKELLTKRLLRNPTYAEIAEYTKLKLNEVIIIMNKSNRILSLDEKIREINDEDANTLGSFIKDETINIERSVLDKIENENLLSFINFVLDEKTKEILFLRLGLNGKDEHRVVELSNMYNVSKQYISHVYLNGIEKIKYLYPMKNKIIEFINEKSLDKYDLTSKLIFKDGTIMSSWFNLNKNDLIHKCKFISDEYKIYKNKYKLDKEILQLRLIYNELLNINWFNETKISCNDFLIMMLIKKNKELNANNLSEILNIDVEKVNKSLYNIDEKLMSNIIKYMTDNIKYIDYNENKKDRTMINSISSN